MCNPNYLANAIETVLTLDFPDHLLSMAIADQAKFNAGFDSDSNVLHNWLDADVFGIQHFQ